MEEWRDVKGYEGIYQVSSYGRVKVLANVFCCKMPNGGIRWNVERIIKQTVGRRYYHVHLTKDGVQKTHFVHRLVASAFCNKNEGREYVNHKDENKLNNRADNLEWVTFLENVNYGSCTERMANKHRKPVVATKNGKEYCFDCAMNASKELGICYSSICKCARGVQHTSGGFIWRYAD